MKWETALTAMLFLLGNATLLFAESSKPPLSDEDAMHLSVITANLHVAAGPDPMPDEGLEEAVITENLDRVAAIFREVSPDLILLQEVDFNSHRSAHIDQGKVLAGKLGMHLTRAITLDTREANGTLPKVLRDCLYGIAILSKSKPAERIAIELPNPPENHKWPVNETRVLLGIHLPLTDSGILFIGNTHLDYRSRATRKEQLDLIRRSLPRHDWILGGDFNEPMPDTQTYSEKLKHLHGWLPMTGWIPFWPGLLGLRSLKKHQTEATYPVENPIVSIDHLFARGRARVINSRRLDSGGVSDHHFVLSVVEVKREKKP